MPRPEDYGIDVNQLVEVLAEADGISIETPHRVTPGTAKALARRAVLAAFEQIPEAKKTVLPQWNEVVLGGVTLNPFSPDSIPGVHDGSEQFRLMQERIGHKKKSGEIPPLLTDLGIHSDEIRIRTSEYEGEKTL